MATAQGTIHDEIRSDQPDHLDANTVPPSRHRSKSGNLRALFSRSRHNSPHGQGGQGDRAPSPHDHCKDHEERRSVSTLGSVHDAEQHMTHEQKIHLEFTRTHPMGCILMNMYKDSLAIAEKTGMHEISCRLPDLCTNFYSTMHIEQDTMKRNLTKAAEKLQKEMIFREINTHMMQVDFPVPTQFSTHPTLKSPSQRGDAMRVFQVKGKKFSGTSEAGSPGIIEFLSNANFAQSQCLLSESEFIEFLLLGTTGYAHALLIDWVNQGENISTLYHNLLTFFDKRISPDAVREALLKIKAEKFSNLNELMSSILSLAGRASSVLPPGEAQKAYFNSEACNALLHSLPPTSSALARNQLILLSAKLAGPVSFNMWCKSLNIFKNQINSDIRENGVEPEIKNANFQGSAQRWRGGNNHLIERPVGYAVDVGWVNYDDDGDDFEENFGGNNAPQPTFQRQTYPQSRNQGQGVTHFQRSNNYGENFETNWDIGLGQQNLDYCNLCGQEDHRAHEGCPFMLTDDGQPIDTLPMRSTCTACPPTVNPKLHHPNLLCPFRPNGPFYESM